LAAIYRETEPQEPKLG